MSNSRTIWGVVAVLLIAALAAGAYLLFRSQDGRGPAPSAEEPATWPLTGKQADGAEIQARVLSVKIDNSRSARPQSGLAGADVVYEILAEGGITRFHALFHSQAPDKVGPVRSARPPDLRLVQMYRSVLVFSGANSQVLDSIEQSGIDALDETAGGQAFERSGDRKAPHNLYADVGAIREVATERGFESEESPPTLDFGKPSAEGSAAATVSIRINDLNRVVWWWTEEEGLYSRELNGEPHGDDGSDDAYVASNVVLLFADVEQEEGATTRDVLLDGSGDAVLFRGGQRYEATWSAAQGSPLQLRTAEGEELPLAVGITWIEVLPADQKARFNQ